MGAKNTTIASGEQRRAMHPGEETFIKGLPEPALLGPRDSYLAELTIEHGYHTTTGGEKIFWQIVRPKDLAAVENVIVFHHGFSDHSGWFCLNKQLTFAKLANTATFAFDMPGHGRSDGLHLLCKEWLQFVDVAVQMVEHVAVPQKEAWEKELGRELKMFGLGESMGGGVLFSLCIKKPDMYDGAIFSAPMFMVSKETRPAPPVEFVLKNIVTPLAPNWQVTPSKDIADQCFTDPAMVEAAKANPFGENDAKPRLRTAVAMGITGCDWMARNLHNFTTRFILLHGEADTVTDPKQSQLFYDSAKTAAPDKEFHLLPGARHVDGFHGGPTQTDLMQSVVERVKAFLIKV